MLRLASSLTFVVLCSACGDRFGANGAAASAGSTGQAGTEANAGRGSSGESSFGGTESGGAAGQPDPGGAGTSGAGATDGGAENGGASGALANGGLANGGAAEGGAAEGGAAGAGSPDCAKMKVEYLVALERARQCDAGSLGQCAPSSTLPGLGCSCPVLVNSKTEATRIARRLYEKIEAADCDVRVQCALCAPKASASCTSQSMGSGSICSDALFPN